MSDKPAMNDGVRPSPYINRRSFRFFTGTLRYLGWFVFIAAVASIFVPDPERERSEMIVIVLLTGSVMVIADFALRILADIEQHTYRSAQCLSQIVASQSKKREQPVTARVVSPAGSDSPTRQ